MLWTGKSKFGADLFHNNVTRTRGGEFFIFMVQESLKVNVIHTSHHRIMHILAISLGIECIGEAFGRTNVQTLVKK